MTNGRLTGVLLGVLVMCLVAGGVGAFLLGRQDAVQTAGAANTDSVGPPTDSGTAPAENTPPADTGENGASPGQDPASTQQPPTPAPGDPAPTSGTGPEESAGAGQSAGDTGAGDTDGGIASEGEPNADSGADSPEQTASAPGDSSGPEDTGSTQTERSSDSGGPDGATDQDHQVRFADGVGEHPQAGDIRDLAQAYFDAINAHDFDAWQTTVTPQEAESTDQGVWTDAYSTTEDAFVVIAAIDDDPLQARVTFISRQDPAKAANKKDCTSWAVTLPVIEQDGAAVVFGRSVEGEAEARDCAG